MDNILDLYHIKIKNYHIGNDDCNNHYDDSDSDGSLL